MNAEEKQLIEDLFARLRNFGGVEKDPEALMLIQDLVRRSPDAPYYLAQTVIVQQQAVERAEVRIRELEDALRQQQQQAPQYTGRGGSFLGGGSSVPQSGSRDAPPSQPGAPDAPRPSFGQAVQAGPQPTQSNSPWGAAAGQGRGGGGFLQSALSTAAGVAGGVFLANSISSLFGGGSSAQAGTGAADQKTADQLQDQAQDAEDDRDQAQRDLADADRSQDEMQDAMDDSGDDYWGSGDDFDI
ncbi:DUF2076 domain-containing protein [Hyphomicrobium sp.]|uniref:DUF2076 domain-containing protein n=1 Tax=Hyphomicrobium sp. TaxID=82 RepID=UPI002D77D891|nr:DUF2076 domain-containing protein [Hyphomicrobium sp.]HET6387836.1 DUF2076 domain-containing protein [Hyphomicrobium sp.]